MTAAPTDLFQKVGRGTATTLGGAGFTAGGTAATVTSTTNWPTDTGVTFAIDEVETVNGEEQRVAGSYNVFRGTVASATSLTNMVYVGGDAARNYSAGATTRVYILVTSAQMNRLIDGILTHSDQDGTLKAGAVDNATVLASDVVTTAKILDANVTTAKLADSSITSAKVAIGMPVQIVSANFTNVATGTALLPSTNVIPQITQGTEFMTLSITPKSATNRLVIHAEISLSNSVANDIAAALFQDATSNALAARATYQGGAIGLIVIPLTHDMVAGTTSATTFRIRAGGSVAGTMTFNGQSGGRSFGGITVSNITITEYKA